MVMNDSNHLEVPSGHPLAARDEEPSPNVPGAPGSTPEKISDPAWQGGPFDDSAWGPTILYLACAVALFLLFFSDPGFLMALPFLAACLTTTIYLFWLALRAVPKSLIRKSLEEGSLVDRPGIQGPRGAFRALCPALGRMVGLHYVCTGFSIWFFIFSQPPFMREAPLFWMFIYSTPIAALFMGAMLATSMWVLAKTRFKRVCAIAGLIFGWVIQYWVIFFIVVSNFRSFESSIFLLILMLSLILPGLIVSWAWRRTEQKLAKMEQCLK